MLIVTLDGGAIFWLTDEFDFLKFCHPYSLNTLMNRNGWKFIEKGRFKKGNRIVLVFPCGLFESWVVREQWGLTLKQYIVEQGQIEDDWEFYD